MQALVFRLSLPRQIASTALGRISKRAFVGPWASLRMEDVAEPVLPAGDWVMLRPRTAGICGSDVKQTLLTGSYDNSITPLISFPQVLGHEVVATVTAVGPDVRGRKVGERVVLNPWLTCAPRGISPLCSPCDDGRYPLCENFTVGALGAGMHSGTSRHVGGAFAPLLAAHESMCIPVPEEIDDERAVLADPVAVALHAVLRRPPTDSALVYGCGTIGLATIALVRALYPDVRVFAVARFPHQQRLAEQFGATLVLPPSPGRALIERVHAETGGHLMRPWYGLPWIHGAGVDVVYDTVGKPGTIEVGLRLVRPRGAIVVTGVEKPGRFEWTPLYSREVEIVGSNAFGIETVNGHRAHAMEHYFSLVQRTGLDLGALVTHRYALAEYRKAFTAAISQGKSAAVKVVFHWDAGR